MSSNAVTKQKVNVSDKGGMRFRIQLVNDCRSDKDRTNKNVKRPEKEYKSLKEHGANAG